MSFRHHLLCNDGRLRVLAYMQSFQAFGYASYVLLYSIELDVIMYYTNDRLYTD